MNASPPDPAGLPCVDVIMSGLNEQRYVERCLRATLAQDYPRDHLRVIYVDGGSSDATVAIARRLADEDPRLSVVAGRARLNLPEAMNIGLERAEGELVAKIDLHGYPETDFLRRAAEVFAGAEADVAAVGGRPVQEGETPWGVAVARARTSRFGTGGSVYAGTARQEYVDSIQCAVYRREALVEAGGFDPAAAYGEDDELNWRLRDRGLRLLLDDSIRFHYFTRPSLDSLFRQYRNYGQAKVRVAALHPRRVRPWHLAPAAFVLTGGTLLILAPVSRWARRLLAALTGLYLSGGWAAASATHGPRDTTSRGRVLACFMAIHLGYGSGMVQALAVRVRRGPV